jgi:hypothetical protein
MPVRDWNQGVKSLSDFCEIRYRSSSQEVVRHSSFCKNWPIGSHIVLNGIIERTLYLFFLYIFIDLAKLDIQDIST